jgi:hypothetical protein
MTEKGDYGVMKAKRLKDAWKGKNDRWVTFIVEDTGQTTTENEETGRAIVVVYAPTRKECNRRAMLIEKALQEDTYEEPVTLTGANPGAAARNA